MYLQFLTCVSPAIILPVGEYLGVPVTTKDVLSSWAGIRPLPSPPKGKGKDSANIVRDHSEWPLHSSTSHR